MATVLLNTTSFKWKPCRCVYVRLIFAVVITLSLFINTPIAKAADVLIASDETQGQGTLQRRGNECLVITPRHVVENATFEIIVTFPDRREVEASILQMYAEDIALLRLAEQPSDGCTERAFNEERLSAILKSTSEGVLKRREGAGESASLLQVDVVGYDEQRFIRIQPRSSTKSIKQGYSGSVLYIDSQPAGMLVSNENTDDEIGVVLRAEMLNAIMNPFFQGVQGDRSFYISADADSQFMLPEFQALAREQKLVIGDDPSETTFDLNVVSSVKNLETDTDKIVEYSTQLVIVDTLDRIVVNQSIAASGNSFVSLESAAQNARKKLIEQLLQSDFLSQLP